MVVRTAGLLQAVIDERLEQLGAIFFGKEPHWCSFSSEPTTITERPE